MSVRASLVSHLLHQHTHHQHTHSIHHTTSHHFTPHFQHNTSLRQPPLTFQPPLLYRHFSTLPTSLTTLSPPSTYHVSIALRAHLQGMARTGPHPCKATTHTSKNFWKKVCKISFLGHLHSSSPSTTPLCTFLLSPTFGTPGRSLPSPKVSHTFPATLPSSRAFSMSVLQLCSSPSIHLLKAFQNAFLTDHYRPFQVDKQS